MTEQPPDFTGTTAPGQQHPASQKLEHLLRSLNRLKSDITDVEVRHPGFGSELSSLCDTVIADLNNLKLPDSEIQQAAQSDLNTSQDKQAAVPDQVPSAEHDTNPVFSVIDKAGNHLIKGLDKTGDGIIFILGKLFSKRAKKADSGTPAEAD
jgi:hypothetical protein